MEILLLCPANLATGGTEGIHNLTRTLCKVGADAKILYAEGDLSDPMPKEFKGYQVSYTKYLPYKDFDGCVIFPEVWANQVLLPKYANCITAVNWQGVDVYKWHNSGEQYGQFLHRLDTIHIANSEYAMHYLKGMGLSPIKISDCLNDDFYVAVDSAQNRYDKVLYNPVDAKFTKFQQQVMARCLTEKGIKFQAVEGYSRAEVIDLFQHSKLYIDFGVFSGRERLPREAVMCGCCILTSNQGTARYYADNAIPQRYKINDVQTAVDMVEYVLRNYDKCKPDFDEYRWLLRQDRMNYESEVARLYNAILNNHPRA